MMKGAGPPTPFMDTHHSQLTINICAGLTIVLVSWARGGQLGRRGKGYQVQQPSLVLGIARVGSGRAGSSKRFSQMQSLLCSTCNHIACCRTFRLMMARAQCVLEFPLACGIGVGTPVRVRGVPVGSVLTVNPSLEKVEVLVEVSDHTPVLSHIWLGCGVHAHPAVDTMEMLRSGFNSKGWETLHAWAWVYPVIHIIPETPEVAKHLVQACACQQALLPGSAGQEEHHSDPSELQHRGKSERPHSRASH